MHKSRFCAFVIDCNVPDLDAAARFWGAAMGREVEAPSETSPNYRGLKVRADEPMMLLQKVDHPSRVHLDIESDDIEAEVARLEALGASRVVKVHTWWVVSPRRSPSCARAV